MGIFDINFWSLTGGSYCSLWNLLDHLLPPGQKQLCACHVLPSPRQVSQTLYPNRVSPEQQFGIFPHFPSPHLTSPPPSSFPACPRFPGFSHCYPQAPGLKHQARTLLSSTSCVAAWSKGKENATLKPSLPHLFSTLGGSSLSTCSFFCSFPPFFPWHCQKAPWHGWEGKGNHEK